LIFAIAARAEEYPGRPIRLIIGYPAGGGMDSIGRAIAQKLSERLGVSVVAENRPGATSTIAAAAVASALPDGYTLLLGETGLLLTPALFPDLPFNLKKDFVPISYVAELPLAFAVTNGFPAKTLQELIAAIKTAPGQYNYATPGVGTVHHLAFEQFEKVAGINAVHVPYKGGATFVPDLIAGRVQIGVLSSSIVGPLDKAGSVRVIAVTSLKRPSNLPTVPTIAETIPNFDMTTKTWLAALAGTPAPIIEILKRATAEALKSKELENEFEMQGAIIMSSDIPINIGAETQRWIEMAKAAGVKPK
jgi:tripartite-type tricarboxylate transporter receptor subunit TctC